jgi:hypothetical protein
MITTQVGECVFEWNGLKAGDVVYIKGSEVGHVFKCAYLERGLCMAVALESPGESYRHLHQYNPSVIIHPRKR